jgi:hypothetical protein
MYCCQRTLPALTFAAQQQDQLPFNHLLVYLCANLGSPSGVMITTNITFSHRPNHVGSELFGRPTTLYKENHV